MTKIKYRLLEHFLNEGRLEDTIKKYSDKLPEPVIKELSQNDPSGNNKYLDWLVKTLIQIPQEKADIIVKIKCYHENVNRLSDNHVKAIYGEEKFKNPGAEHLAVLEKIRKTPKDINAFPSHHWITPMCEYFEEQKPKNASRVKLYEDDKWLVVSPLTHQASCSYGAFSNWCVSTTNPQYFGTYTSEGILVFFIDKQGYNPRKKDANQYKFAVNIKYDYPKMEDWDWYSMEDARIESQLMMNLVPKNLLNITEKYFEEVLREIGKQSKVDEKDLTANSLFWFQNRDNYYVFARFENWDNNSMERTTDFLKKYNNNRPFKDMRRYKDSGLPYFTITIRNGRLPQAGQSNLSWSAAINSRDIRTGLIPMPRVKEQMTNRWGGYNTILERLNDEQKTLFYNQYKDMFNKAEITRNQQVRTTELQVGDRIVHRPQGRGWGQGETVTVLRVTDKSLVLSNGKRIAKTNTNYKEKVLGVMKIVDELPQEQQPVRTESRWIRKRII